MSKKVMRDQVDKAGNDLIGVPTQQQDFVFSQGSKIAILDESVADGSIMVESSDFVFAAGKGIVREGDKASDGDEAEGIGFFYVFTE